MWTQGLISFALWLVYGAIQWRRSKEIHSQMSALQRIRRITGAAVLMLASAVVLLAGLFAVELLGGFTRTAMTPLGWLGVTVIGLAFVHAQTLAAAMLVSLVRPAVTEEAAAASSKRDTEVP
jgi:multidrug efflux pump subunit AcrB